MEREIRIPSEFTMGMDREERVEFLKAWENATWLTSKIKTNIKRKLDVLIEHLIDFDPDVNNSAQIRADIKAYRYMLRMLP